MPNQKKINQQPAGVPASGENAKPTHDSAPDTLAAKEREEKERRDRDMENLRSVASELSKQIVEHTITETGASMMTGELAREKANIEASVAELIKTTQESGDDSEFEDKVNTILAAVVAERAKYANYQRGVRLDRQIVQRMRGLEEGLAEAEGVEGDEMTDEQAKLLKEGPNRLLELKTQHDRNTEFSKARWENLPAEDKEVVTNHLRESIDAIFSNSETSDEEKAKEHVKLIAKYSDAWGEVVANEVVNNARNQFIAERNKPSTEEVEIVEREEEENPVRARGVKGFLDKVKFAWKTKAGGVDFLSRVFSKEGESLEDEVKRGHKIRLAMGTTALTAAAGVFAWSAYRGISSIDGAQEAFGGFADKVSDLFGMESMNTEPQLGDVDLGGGEPTGYDPSESPDAELASGRPRVLTDEEMRTIDEAREGGGAEAALSGAEGLEDGEGPESGWQGHNNLDHGYDIANSPFSDEGKTGHFNYGAPLMIDENFDSNLLDSADSEYAYHAQYIQLFGIEGGTGTEDEIINRLMNDPDYFKESLAAIEERMANSETRVYELAPGTYGSSHAYEMDGQVHLAYTDVVNEPATVKEYIYTDSNGIEHKVLIKSDCGGQVVFPHDPVNLVPVPIEQPVVQPIGGGDVPAAPVYEQPVYTPEQPQEVPVGGGDVPPVTEEPPVNPTPEAPKPTPVDPTPETPPVEPEKPVVPDPTPETPPDPTPETPIDPPAAKDDDLSKYVDMGGAPAAEQNEPYLPPAQAEETAPIVLDPEDYSNIAPPVEDSQTVIENPAREDFIEQNTIEDVARYDLETSPETAIEQSTDTTTVDSGDGQTTNITFN